MPMLDEVYIVKGKVTDPSAYENARMGQTEYQFSDGPANNRSESADYVDLEQGLKDHSGMIIHWEG
jgi:hypothetical protein